MAATPKRADACEAALLGRPWDLNSVRLGMAALREDFTPMSDVRASSVYRLNVAANLLQRFWLETRSDDDIAQPPVRLDQLAPIGQEAR